MDKLVLMGAIFLLMILYISSHSVLATGDPQHCRGYNSCYAIGYRDGYNDAQNRLSPASACVGHSENWCAGYNDGFRAGNDGSSMDKGVTKPQT